MGIINCDDLARNFKEIRIRIFSALLKFYCFFSGVDIKPALFGKKFLYISNTPDFF